MADPASVSEWITFSIDRFVAIITSWPAFLIALIIVFRHQLKDLTERIIDELIRRGGTFRIPGLAEVSLNALVREALEEAPVQETEQIAPSPSPGGRLPDAIKRMRDILRRANHRRVVRGFAPPLAPTVVEWGDDWSHRVTAQNPSVLAVVVTLLASFSSTAWVSLAPDTSYDDWIEAVEVLRKTHGWDVTLPITPKQFSDIQSTPELQWRFASRP